MYNLCRVRSVIPIAFRSIKPMMHDTTQWRDRDRVGGRIDATHVTRVSQRHTKPSPLADRVTIEGIMLTKMWPASSTARPDADPDAVQPRRADSHLNKQMSWDSFFSAVTKPIRRACSRTSDFVITANNVFASAFLVTETKNGTIFAHPQRSFVDVPESIRIMSSPDDCT